MSSTKGKKPPTKDKHGKAKPPEAELECIRIPISEVRIGDRIAIKMRTEMVDPETFMETGETRTIATNTKKVANYDICPGQWRTHVHINRMECYWEQALVWVVK